MPAWLAVTGNLEAGRRHEPGQNFEQNHVQDHRRHAARYRHQEP
jgi:hypothetical protein